MPGLWTEMDAALRTLLAPLVGDSPKPCRILKTRTFPQLTEEALADFISKERHILPAAFLSPPDETGFSRSSPRVQSTLTYRLACVTDTRREAATRDAFLSDCRDIIVDATAQQSVNDEFGKLPSGWSTGPIEIATISGLQVPEMSILFCQFQVRAVGHCAGL